MNVISNIININKLLSDYFNDDVYDMFLNKYCLEYYEILKLLYPNCQMVIEKHCDHCACLIDGDVYDVAGFCDKNNFYIASENDLNFVYSFDTKFDDELKIKLIKYLICTKSMSF